MGTIEKIYQALIKVFVRSNKRFPVGKELQDLEKQAREVFDGAINYNLDQAKGKNLDDIVVMEQTTEKSGDQLIDDYLSNEANKGTLTSEPTFTQVDERTLPRAEIEALPLKDKEKAEAAVKKKLEAQNVQAKQSRQGGETPGGPQRGRPEAVDDNFRDTIYIDKSEMQQLTDQAWKQFDAAESAMAQGKFDEARAILKYEIADNYQFPANIREAADDARNMIDRNGLAWKDMGYESYDEGLEVFNEKIAKGQQQTMEDNWVDFTDPLEPDKQKSQRIEYVSFFDEPGEDFGTPNDSISDISKLFYNYADGGKVVKRKGFLQGSDDDAADEDQGFSQGDLDSANEATSGMGSEQSGGGGGYSQADLDRANARTTSQVGSFGSRVRNTARNVANFMNQNRMASYLTSLAAGPLGIFASPALAYASLYGPRPGRGITASTAGGDFIEEEEQLTPFSFPQADLSSFYTLRDQFRKDYMPNKYQSGGRVGFSKGGIKGKLIELINKISKSKRVKQSEAEDFAKLLDDIEQARKAGIIDEAGFKSFQRGIESMRDAAYGSRMKYQGAVPGSKSALPVDDKDLVPKTNLKKIRQKIYKDRQDLLELAKNEQIPVKQIDDLLSGKIKKVKRSAGRGMIEMDDAGVPYVTETFSDKYGTAWIRAEKARLKGLIKVLQTPMLKNDRIDDLKVLEKVEELGGDKAMYDDLRMRKFKNLPSKSEYRFDPDEAERKASRQMSKTKKEVDQLLGIKDDDPNMFDDTFNKMFQEYQESKPLPGEKPLTKKKRKLNAKGGLNYLMGF
jgi:hypothetical protein